MCKRTFQSYLMYLYSETCLNPLNTKLSAKYTIFNRLVRFFGCHDAN